MISTTSFTKNFIISDFCALKTKNSTDALRDTYKSADLYNIISPNIILHSVYSNFLNIDLSSYIPHSYVFRSLMSTFERINDKPFTNALLLNIVNEIVKELSEYTADLHQKYNTKLLYMTEVEYNMYNSYLSGEGEGENDNNIFLMEIALLVSHYATTFDDNLKKLSEFVNSITKNSIKILSFISIGIFAYYAKMYAKSNDNLYKKEKWMNRLIDLFMDGSIKKYLTDIDNNEYKKFMFMIIKYTVVSDTTVTIPYSRIDKIKQCYLTAFDDKYDHIPGYTADQLFLITYDLFISSHNWMLFLTSSTMIYTELLHVNIIMSWYYFTLNNEDISKYFNITGSEKELQIFKSNENDIIQLLSQSSSKDLSL